MQFASIGRQVFTKLLRKNALLFSSPPGGQPKSSKGGNSNNINSTKLLDSQHQPQLQLVPQEDLEIISDPKLNLSLTLSKNASSPHPSQSLLLDKRLLISVAFHQDNSHQVGSSRRNLFPLPASRMMQQQQQVRTRNSVCNVSMSSSRGVNTIMLSNLDEEGKVFEAVSLAEMKRFLRKHEIPFEDGYTCLRVDCFFCKKSHRKKKYFPWDSDKLYVNKTTGKCTAKKITVCFSL